MSREIQQWVAAADQEGEPPVALEVAERVDWYDSKAPEMLVMADTIQVK